MRRKRGLRLASLLVSAAVMYAALLCHPDPLFAYSVRGGTIMLHSPQPLPACAIDIARAADARVARSPLYDPRAVHHVYLSDTSWRFALFSSYRYRAGGVAYGGLTQNAFLRPSRLERDRLVRWDGSEVPAERTLSYFIAHEVVHAMLSAHLGRLRYLRLPTWQNEGYADYVAKAGTFDYARELQRYRQGAPELDPARSGLYLRYHLSVSYWLDRRGLSVAQLLSLPEEATGLDAALR
jgi:hypothetical protein